MHPLQWVIVTYGVGIGRNSYKTLPTAIDLSSGKSCPTSIKIVTMLTFSTGTQ